MPHFSDVGAEAQVASAIVVGEYFEMVPETYFIEPQEFYDPVWKVVYAAALILRKRGQSLSPESINNFIRDVGWEKNFQHDIDSTKTFSWEKWPEKAHLVAGKGDATPRVIKCALERIHCVYVARRSKEIREDPNLDNEGVISGLRGLHGSNGSAPDWAKLGELHKRRVNLENPPAKPVTVLSLGSAEISTPGNLTSIFAQAKAGKSAVVGAIIGSAISEGAGDFLGWSVAGNSEEAGFLHFDTEQSPYKHYEIIATAMARSGCKELPKWVRSYYMADIELAKRFEYIKMEIKEAVAKHGAVRVAILDGVGDLIADTNDIKIATELVSELHALAIKYDMVIVCILHENPAYGKGDNGQGKPRGHLGSQLERKSEANVLLRKNKDGITTQFTSRSRNAEIPENKGPKFLYDSVAGMHVTTTGPGEIVSEEDKEILGAVFARPEALGGLAWGILRNLIMDEAGIKSDAAIKRITKYSKLKLIRKNNSKLYIQG